MKVLNQVKKYSIGAIIVAFVLGAAFVMFPDKCITYTSLAIGIGFIAMGVVGIVSYLTDKSTKYTLILGILTVLVGIVICAKYKTIISIIVVIFGIFILTTGLVNFFTGIKVIMSSMFTGWVTVLLSVVTSIFGIVAITKSTQLTEGIVRFLGVALIIYGVLDIFAYIQVKKIAKDVKSTIEAAGDIQTDATVVEEVEDEGFID